MDVARPTSIGDRTDTVFRETFIHSRRIRLNHAHDVRYFELIWQHVRTLLRDTLLNDLRRSEFITESYYLTCIIAKKNSSSRSRTSVNNNQPIRNHHTSTWRPIQNSDTRKLDPGHFGTIINHSIQRLKYCKAQCSLTPSVCYIEVHSSYNWVT